MKVFAASKIERATRVLEFLIDIECRFAVARALVAHAAERLGHRVDGA